MSKAVYLLSLVYYYFHTYELTRVEFFTTAGYTQCISVTEVVGNHSLAIVSSCFASGFDLSTLSKKTKQSLHKNLVDFLAFLRTNLG